MQDRKVKQRIGWWLDDVWDWFKDIGWIIIMSVLLFGGMFSAISISIHYEDKQQAEFAIHCQEKHGVVVHDLCLSKDSKVLDVQ